jgi:glycosyltransferase involved in cell wall biosynthesis/SAM-dependent methyltransferase
LKILFLSMEYPPETGLGGIGSYVKSLAPALAARGHEVHVLSCVEGQQRSDYLDGPVFVHRRGQMRIQWLGRVLRAPRAMSRINTAISCWLAYRKLGIGFDVVEIPDWMAEGWLMALIGSKPLVAHLHTPLRLIAKHNGRPLGWDGILSDRIERTAVRRAHVVTSPSQLLAADLQRDGWLRGDVAILRYPVDYCHWATIPLPIATDPVVLFVGRLEPRKAPEVLLEAAGKLRAAVPGLRVDFVGRSIGTRNGLAYSEWLRARATELGVQCRFPGPVKRDELHTWYASARVVVVPSLYDNFPMAALEGMASARPLVCTSSTGAAEIVAESQAGKVVPAGEPDALARALVPYLADPSTAAEAGARARDVVKRCCAPERVAEDREACYETAIARWRRLRAVQSTGLPHAAPTAGRLAPRWCQWAVEEASVAPWKHFYLRTGEHLLDLLGAHPFFARRGNLSGMRVLDLAATPAVSALLACLEADVVTLDLAQSEMEKVTALRDTLGIKDHLFGLRADAFRVPLRAGSFDLVLSSGFIEHFDDPLPIVETMVSLARSRGAVCLLVPSRWTPHTAFIRRLQRGRPGGYYWDCIGRERSYTATGLRAVLRRAGVRVLRTCAYNLRRSIVDDSLLVTKLDRAPFRKLLYGAMNALDWTENRFPSVRRLGFMVGALGEVP